jgi:heterodisulfide reductase subunit C
LDSTSTTEFPHQIFSLRKLILLNAGQDVRRCRDCAMCNARINEQHLIDTMDISIETLVQMVLWNDEEVLTSRTLWSPEVYDALMHACVQGLNLQAIVTTLREEANIRRRNE